MNALKAVVKSIAISFPGRLTLEQLEHDYKNTEGHNLPFKVYGFNSVHDMLREGMKDILRMYGSGPKAQIVPIINERSEHIARLVMEQKNSPKIRPNRDNVRVRVRTGRNRTRNRDVGNSPVRRNAFQNGYTRNRYSPQRCDRIDRNPPDRENTFRSAMIARSSEPKRNRYRHFAKKVDRMDSVREEETMSNNWREKSVYRSNNNDRRPVCDGSNNLLSRNEYRNDAIDNRVRPSYPKKIEEKEHIRTQSNPPKNQECSKIDSINYEHGTKVHTNEKHVGFEPCITEKLDGTFAALNISNLTEEETNHLNDLDSISSSNCLISIDRRSSDSSSSEIFYIPKKKQIQNYIDEAIPDFAFDRRLFLLDFPESTVQFGTKIEPMEMPSYLTVDTLFPIYIAEIHNAYRFWFHVGQESSDLDELMHNMERFYENLAHNSEYTIMRELIQCEQICAALFYGFWHRAKILTDYIIDEKVKVLFIDYGTVCTVDINTIKYLRKEFAELPAFAHRGALAEITPVGLHWGTASSIEFLALCHDRLLYAKVSEIDLKNRVYYLNLCDTHGTELIHINRRLISIGHALKSTGWLKSKQNGTPRIPHKREEYPTFDLLEAGEYPTLNDIIEMERKGIHYETITDKMVYYPYILNFKKDMPAGVRDLSFYLLSNNPFANDLIKELTENEATTPKSD